MILAIDPGKNKCGFAVLNEDSKVLEKGVIPRPETIKHIKNLIIKHSVTSLVVGRSAFGKDLEKEILDLDPKANIIFISEKNSTLEARQRYWEENQPQGFWRLVPTTLRIPPRPIDDYAAVILGERYLKA